MRLYTRTDTRKCAHTQAMTHFERPSSDSCFLQSSVNISLDLFQLLVHWSHAALECGSFRAANLCRPYNQHSIHTGSECITAKSNNKKATNVFYFADWLATTKLTQLVEFLISRQTTKKTNPGLDPALIVKQEQNLQTSATPFLRRAAGMRAIRNKSHISCIHRQM